MARVDSWPAMRAETSRSPPVTQVFGDSDAAEAVGADIAGQAGMGGAALDHLEGGGAGHRTVQERVVLRGGEQGGLAGLDDVFGAVHRTRGVEGQDLADDEPVEEHGLRRQVLLVARG